MDFRDTKLGKIQSSKMVLCRKKLGFKTAMDFWEAKSTDDNGNLLFSYQKYAKHENGERKLNTKSAAIYADLFKVDPSWLLAADEGESSKTDLEISEPTESKDTEPVITAEIVNMVVLAIEEYLEETNRSLKPVLKAELISGLCEKAVSIAAPERQAKIIEFADFYINMKRTG